MIRPLLIGILGTMIFSLALAAAAPVVLNPDHTLYDESRAGDEPVFRSAVFLAVDGHGVYVSDNLRHRVLQYELNPALTRLRFVRQIGRPGQGPGDLWMPSNLTIDHHTLAIHDATGVVFFTPEGQFLHRVRLVIPGVLNMVSHDRLYGLDTNPQTDHFLNVFDTRGQSVGNLGRKPLRKRLDSFLARVPDTRNKVHLLLDFYKGQLFPTSRGLCYVNLTWGFVTEFDFAGHLQRTVNLAERYGSAATAITRWNTTEFETYLKNTNYTQIHDMFNRVYATPTRFYLLSAALGDDAAIAVKVIDRHRLQPVEAYRLRKPDHTDMVYSFFVHEDAGGTPTFLVFMSLDRGQALLRYRVAR